MPLPVTTIQNPNDLPWAIEDDEDLPLAELDDGGLPLASDIAGAGQWVAAPAGSHVSAFYLHDRPNGDIWIDVRFKNSPARLYRYKFDEGQRQAGIVVWEELQGVTHPGIVIWEWLIRPGVYVERL